MKELAWIIYTDSSKISPNYIRSTILKKVEIKLFTLNLFKKQWHEYTTITKKDIDILDRDINPIDNYESLPVCKKLFEAEEGISRFEFLQQELFFMNKNAVCILKEDYDLVQKDLKKIIDFLKIINQNNGKWYLEIEWYLE